MSFSTYKLPLYDSGLDIVKQPSMWNVIVKLEMVLVLLVNCYWYVVIKKYVVTETS